MCRVRTRSPSPFPEAKTPETKDGIMRVKTLRDSLSSCCSSSSTATNSQQDASLSRSVRFSEVQIREYAITIGDNPSCSAGTPISLDWMHAASDLRVHIEKYEEYREPRRREHAQLRIPSTVRLDLLLTNWNYSLTSIMDANFEMSIIREQRKKDFRKARKARRREESRSAKIEKLKKAFSIKRSDKKKINTLVQVESSESDSSDTIFIVDEW